MRELLIFLVRIYQAFFSPLKALFGGTMDCCRYSPSCAEYAVGALKNHGSVTGVILATRRVMRCHPWGGAGHDPVPEKKKVLGCHG